MPDNLTGKLALATADDGKLDPAIVSDLFQQHADELRRFVAGVLRDGSQANDIVQVAFSKLLEHGQGTRQETRKAWLFRVAYHEALLVRRKESVAQHANESLAWLFASTDDENDCLVRSETIERVRAELQRLPEEQRVIVQRRIYGERTFAQIAAELKIPLGTALARMRTAIRKLRERLDRV